MISTFNTKEWFTPKWKARYIVKDVQDNSYFVCSRHDCGFTREQHLADTFLTEDIARATINNERYIEKTNKRNLEIQKVWRYV